MMDKTNLQDSNDFSESVLISQRIIPYLRNLGYRYLESEAPVSIGAIKARADVIVYRGKEKVEPYIVVEAKRRLPSEITLLDPAVQQAFTIAVALGTSVRYLLVTDGRRYQWFERSSEGSSLVQLTDSPETDQKTDQLASLSKSLIPVTDPDQFVRLMRSAAQVLAEEGVVSGLRLGIELNRILIAKLHDEQVMLAGGNSNFISYDEPAELVARKIEQLYKAAIIHLNGVPTPERGWLIPPQTLLTVVRILEPYALSFVTSSIRGHFFWQALSNFTRVGEGTFTTPVPLAELLVQLVRPRKDERIIDPACGTGLFLIESLKYMEAQSFTEEKMLSDLQSVSYQYQQNVLGVEWNAEVAELAITNLVLNSISPRGIIRANALNRRELERFGIQMGAYDIVLLDPPIGIPVKDLEILHQYAILGQSGRATSEMLFVELAIELARPGGVLALVVPDSLLALPSYLQLRRWILDRTTPRAIISLPTEAFAPAGHSGKATILLLKKNTSDARIDDTVLVADVQSVGYDKYGQTVGQSDLPDLIEAVRTFLETGQVKVNGHESQLKVWSVNVKELSDTRLDVLQLSPTDRDIFHALQGSRYSTVRLDQLVDVISGHNFKKYVEKGPNTALVLQAGSVRDLALDFSTAPAIALEEYENMKRAQVKMGDVLVTTGQYLGRAAAIDDLPDRAVASGAVTILRPLPESKINPFFLAAVISSELGKKQIAQRAISIAQPYIRRTDLGTISIPLPDLWKQQEIVARIRAMLTESQKLIQRVHELELTAKQLVITELLEADDNA
jgi:type I restriction enzyme M protein